MSALKGRTKNFGFGLINFDWPRWSSFEWDNWNTLDAVLNLALTNFSVKGAWAFTTAYAVGDRVVDVDNSTIYQCQVAHTSPATGTFADYRTANPTHWSVVSSVPIYRGAWSNANIAYGSGDIVVNGYAYYLCVAPNNSSTVALTDNTYWTLIFDATVTVGDAVAAKTTAVNAAASASQSATDANTYKTQAATSATNAATSEGNALTYKNNAAQSATNAATSESNALTYRNNAATSATNAATSETNAKTSENNAKTSEQNAATSASQAATFNPALYALRSMLAGVMVPFAGATPPAGTLLCYGQNVSRTTYAKLFAAIGTAWGAGDGSTTFTLPDMRGRVAAGKDDMGGSVASRLTGFSNMSGTVLGSYGGSEFLHAHAHTGSGTTSGVGDHQHSGSGTTSGWNSSHRHDLPMNTSNVEAGGYGLTSSFPGFTDRVFITSGNVIKSGWADTDHSHTYSFNTSFAGAHSHTYSFTTSTAGSGNSLNVQPTAIANYIIFTGD